jgi:hypothetical protein
VDTGENPQISVIGGTRDAGCNAVLRIRYNSLSNPAINGIFRLMRLDAPLTAILYLPNGYDSGIAIPRAILGDGTTPTFRLERNVSGTWVPCRCAPLVESSRPVPSSTLRSCPSPAILR